MSRQRKQDNPAWMIYGDYLERYVMPLAESEDGARLKNMESVGKVFTACIMHLRGFSDGEIMGELELDRWQRYFFKELAQKQDKEIAAYIEACKRKNRTPTPPQEHEKPFEEPDYLRGYDYVDQEAKRALAEYIEARKPSNKRAYAQKIIGEARSKLGEGERITVQVMGEQLYNSAESESTNATKGGNVNPALNYAQREYTDEDFNGLFIDLDNPQQGVTE